MEAGEQGQRGEDGSSRAKSKPGDQSDSERVNWDGLDGRSGAAGNSRWTAVEQDRLVGVYTQFKRLISDLFTCLLHCHQDYTTHVPV